MVRVGLVQLDLARGTGDRQSPLRDTSAAHRGLQAAADAGAEVIVLPELWRTGPFELAETLVAAEPEMHGETLELLRTWAGEAGVWLHGGSVLCQWSAAEGPRRVANTAFVVNPSGDVVATYRKRHLFGFDEGEAALLAAGEATVVVDTPLGPTGLATCYDLRFPEHFRALLDAGATSVVVPAGWPAARIGHWQTLAAARAIENQTWLVAVNATGRSGPVALGGHSCVVDPWGQVVAMLDADPGVVVVDVDPSAVERIRREFPVLRDRRPSGG